MCGRRCFNVALIVSVLVFMLSTTALAFLFSRSKANNLPSPSIVQSPSSSPSNAQVLSSQDEDSLQFYKVHKERRPIKKPVKVVVDEPESELVSIKKVH